MQQTLKHPLTIEGIGLHSGCKVKLVINPAPENHGIVFRRVDLPGQPKISALYSNVADTRNCTCLGDRQGTVVSTIEHLMAALRVAEIDNALIDVDNQELPIMDGSAKPFYDALSSAEILVQKAPRKYLKVKKRIAFSDEKGNAVSLEPADEFNIRFDIDFPSPVVGHQSFDGILNKALFEKQIAPCRTFCEKYQVDYLKSVGLIKGGSLENAVVLDGDRLLNPEGFRVANECVNHKVLDAVGDMYTAGYYIIGRLTADKTGHFHNNELLKRLFADSSNYELV